VENISTGYESYRVQVRGHTERGLREGVNVYLWKNSTALLGICGKLGYHRENPYQRHPALGR
jgi:hypothetical protein